ncbi:MAG: single-stranded DNA-binding protein [Candidatus Komeilibacteria bacterium]|jgi:single-strand DNA-binding protein|nr:single-stranded DNA-binding protein [Candidatus Komeilibacteria bacterium]MBT4447976.1 single-stranded DNA-binding protein [Candidatus Komeilibacteria bacterium]
MNLNKAMIIGNVVRDPEMRSTPTGQNVTSYSIATNRVWNDTNGQKQERAEFHNIVAWRRLAEISSQYLKKGSKVYIEGRLQTRSWDDPNGVKKYRTEIIAENMIMLDRAGSTPSGGDFNTEQPSMDKTPAVDVNQASAPKPSSDSSEEEISIEDIPF